MESFCLEWSSPGAGRTFGGQQISWDWGGAVGQKGTGAQGTSQKGPVPRLSLPGVGCSIKGQKDEKTPPSPIMHALLSRESGQ